MILPLAALSYTSSIPSYRLVITFPFLHSAVHQDQLDFPGKCGKYWPYKTYPSRRCVGISNASSQPANASQGCSLAVASDERHYPLSSCKRLKNSTTSTVRRDSVYLPQNCRKYQEALSAKHGRATCSALPPHARLPYEAGYPPPLPCQTAVQ
ncbi:hypothetical protein M413DRAFT_279987 [Hebeloma cylindrosporum]|uniref:Uncharacterized protein n=1 Tax=Hebeloma cylindrosporum TaxID=76867 RepID=A0A0C2XGE7_HEBCY|nr:hypothetical protein M413DRAFT_279987 [Hebeloma cylindrosporum h7]